VAGPENGGACSSQAGGTAATEDAERPAPSGPAARPRGAGPAVPACDRHRPRAGGGRAPAAATPPAISHARAPPPPIDAPCTQCLRHGDQCTRRNDSPPPPPPPPPPCWQQQREQCYPDPLHGRRDDPVRAGGALPASRADAAAPPHPFQTPAAAPAAAAAAVLHSLHSVPTLRWLWVAVHTALRARRVNRQPQHMEWRGVAVIAAALTTAHRDDHKVRGVVQRQG
jgi:hypothetical protein